MKMKSNQKVKISGNRGGLSANTAQVEKHKEVQGISEVSCQTPICESQIVNSTSITTNQENPKELISSLYPLNPSRIHLLFSLIL